MRGSKVLSWVVLCAVALGIVTMLGLVTYRQGVAAQRAEAQDAEILALQAGLEEANARLEAEGEAPVPVPEPVDPGTDPPVVQPFPVGPTTAQMDAALERYCATHDCTPGPTRAQVTEALADLCSEIRCRGEDGEDSTVPGPPPTAEQIDAAQARYCDARNECRGADGSNGADGDDGVPGRGLQSMQCATGGWVIQYTDGLFAPDPGPCRGPQGEQGEPGKNGIDGKDGTARPGTYTCPVDEYATGFTVAEDGAVELSCQAPPPVLGPPVPTPTPTPEEN